MFCEEFGVMVDKVNADYCYYFLTISYMFKLRIFSLSLDLLVCLHMTVECWFMRGYLSTAVTIDALISPKVTFLILTVTTT